MLRLVSSMLSSLFVWLALAAPSAAQCPKPDQLDLGLCCNQAQLAIPAFPNFRQDAMEICWRDCTVSGTINYRAIWQNITIAPSTGLPCGERLVQLTLNNTLGVMHWTGRLRLQYSRTWLETDPAGFQIQVWRFLANGDMRPNTTLPVPCPAPVCAAAHNGRVRFSGYVDYAASCNLVPSPFQHAWMLTHACDAIDHHAGFPRAGAFHPDRAYTFVGPLAGFVPGPMQPVEGTPGSPFEAMHRRNLPPPGAVGPITCEFEERLGFILNPVAQFCMCGPAVAPPQMAMANANIFGACGNSLVTPGGPLLPGFLSMGIGTWTAPGVYPGVEAVRWNAAEYADTNACTGVVTQEVYYGVTTIGGYPAQQLTAGGPGAALPPFFIDQSNARRLPNGLGIVMNVPYISEHILNLNH